MHTLIQCLIHNNSSLELDGYYKLYSAKINSSREIDSISETNKIKLLCL